MPAGDCAHTGLTDGLFVSLAVVWSGPAVARTVPETLAEGKPVQPGEVVTAFSIDYVGVVWDVSPGQEHAPGAGSPEPHGALRFLEAGEWGPWTALVEDDVRSKGQWASVLVAAHGAEAYQVRGLPPGAADAEAVASNTTDGPPVTVGEEPGGAAQALSNSQCRSRADWGADDVGVAQVSFAVDGTAVDTGTDGTGSVRSCDAAGNADPDGDSDGTTITVPRGG